jgi:pilus assembly protein Flp/PilA
MRSIWSRVRKFMRREDGPTAVEYAIMLALIVVVCLASVRLLGRDSRREFRSVGRTLGTANGS